MTRQKPQNSFLAYSNRERESVCGQSFKAFRRAAGKRHRGQVFQDSSGKIQFSAYTGAELPLRGAFISGDGCKRNTSK